ncbi:hypothetical protein [Streptomyces sparsogenes]|uniref:deoxynucleotide monophosphate kinase family protein n=1 Tax=Streptomyces sparsogenes TaxID=67365 RepID=UPI0033DB7AFC
MPNIGLIGLARSGKDTAGKWLVDNRGYSRVAFADPLRQAALKLDPIVLNRMDEPDRLSRIVRDYGWERAKDLYPETRRVLQELGSAMRELDEDFWLRAALSKVRDVNETTGRPAVITDVRYPNEAAELRHQGFHLVYIDRPGLERLDHPSEGALTAGDADYTIVNLGVRLEDFYRDVELFWKRVNDYETRRETNRSVFPF